MYSAHATLSETTGLPVWPSVYPAALWQGASKAHLGDNCNPLLSSKDFCNYHRNIVRKKKEGMDPLWQKNMEEAFFKAILLVPIIGRRKLKLKDTLYGRNMLISEYLWLSHWSLFPPAPEEIIPTGASRLAHPKYRTRKQVSSHLQVLKGFFKTLPLFHFFFPQTSEGESEERSPWNDQEGQTEAFQKNPVLIALAEGRLPEVQPNYDYFAHLLAADSEVFLRPKRCHIYLSIDGDCKTTTKVDDACLYDDTYAPGGTRLESPGDRLHRSALDEPRTYLLHEYTRLLTQSESRPVRNISSKWGHRIPGLRDKLMSALDETHLPHERPARCVMGPCDIIHMQVVVDLPGSSQFPTGTSLDTQIEFSISRPELVNHLWCSSTCVAKPWELRLDASEPPVWDRASACRPLRRSGAPDVIEIDFPATSWGNMLYRLTKYAEVEREREGDRGPTEGRGEKGSGSPGLCDLLQQVAMYQEIWSAPSGGSGETTWTRRAVLLWTLSTTKTKIQGGGGDAGDGRSKKQSRVPAGTTWRFLSKLDSLSQYHQQRAYLLAADVPYDDTRVPDQGGQQQPGPVVCGSFYNFHHGGDVALSDQLQEPHVHPASWDTVDGCWGGLVAPQAAAYPPFNHSQSFGGATIEGVNGLQPPLGYMFLGQERTPATASISPLSPASYLGHPMSTGTCSHASVAGIRVPQWGSQAY